MSSLEDARRKINDIDQEMARLFEERMRAVDDIAKYKMERGLPILDSKREEEVVERNSRLIDEELRPYYTKFLRSMMATSRAYQMQLFSNHLNAHNRIDIQTALFSYPVHFIRGGLERVGELFSLNRKVLILTDEGVPSSYAEMVADACLEPVIYTLVEGEGAKTLSHFEAVERILLQNGFSRRDCLVAVGGGVVSDLGGFVASAYMRGIDFYNIPTTLLSMVDASVGGKTAINFEGGKNLLGAFYPPRGVLIDANTLNTLPKKQFSSGLSEVVKMAVTLDDTFFRFLEECEMTNEEMDAILYHSVLLKARVVEEDEREGGKRKLLNFGHTFGHAIEMALGGKWTHGECVALGMLAFSSSSVRERLLSLYKKMEFPISLPIKAEDVVDLLSLDKKRDGAFVDAVFVDEIGSGSIQRISLDEIKKIFLKTYEGDVV